MSRKAEAWKSKNWKHFFACAFRPNSFVCLLSLHVLPFEPDWMPKPTNMNGSEWKCPAGFISRFRSFSLSSRSRFERLNSLARLIVFFYSSTCHNFHSIFYYAFSIRNQSDDWKKIYIFWIEILIWNSFSSLRDMILFTNAVTHNTPPSYLFQTRPRILTYDVRFLYTLYEPTDLSGSWQRYKFLDMK